MRHFADLVLTDDERLCSAIVDGAGMPIAAGNARRIEDAIAAVDRELAAARILLHGARGSAEELA